MEKITNNAPNSISIGWEVTTTCNYSCWYCPSHLHDGKYKWPDLESALDFFNTISQHKQYVAIDILGGEPTLWPQLSQFLIRRPHNSHVTITSNGSRTPNWWSKNIENIDSVYLSFHPDTADIEQFYQVCKTISNKQLYPNKDIRVSIMTSSLQIDRCNQLYDKLSNLSLSCKMRAIDNRIDYNQETFDLIKLDHKVINSVSKRFNNQQIKSNSYIPSETYIDGRLLKDGELAQLEFQGLAKFKGWMCNAGVNRLYITADGNIYRASCKSGGKIGNINFDTNVFNLNPSICEKQKCSCIDEIRLEKYKFNV